MTDSSSRAAQRHNRQAWDRMVERRDRFAKPVRDKDLSDPLANVDARGWLGISIEGRQVLCLAAGGGRQSAIYAAAGGKVTVVDLSPAMLQLDREVANEKGYSIRTIETSMDDLSMLQTAEFDLVIHPVSTCYLPDLAPVYREVARVTRPGGLYVSQHKQPASMQASIEVNAQGRYEYVQTYFATDPLPPSPPTPLREPGTWEYVHRWETLLGLMCRSGFVIEDLVEPVHAKPADEIGSFGHRACYIAPYVRIKARRVGGSAAEVADQQIWTP